MMNLMNILIWMIAIFLSLWALTESPLMDWVDKKLANNERTATFFNYSDEDIAELNAKKAPTAATAETSEPNENIIYLSLSRQQPKRKAAK
ncbi:hypothetical protein [Lacticaseibacillus mingshuiensis]|uniref:hypothetical protein n=1 Tax=Lacticaseibacillus mingshuiensis TaxID=2799574 RepID=UPI00194F642C|nr:hypothetical protein [Lacticaseibacillus mingshuiensis]